MKLLSTSSDGAWAMLQANYRTVFDGINIRTEGV